jgi:beta-galactosidase
MGMDGSVTPQAEMGAKLGRWANSHEDIWKSRPVKGDVGIVYVPESQDFNAVQNGRPDNYNQSVQGAYEAFFDSNIQADFVSIDDIGEYPLIYLPYPEMLKKSTADKLRDYVAKGGKLVSEGVPGYFGDTATVGTTQPNLGLDQLFGARERYVQFTPDLLDTLEITVKDKKVGGRFFLQEYTLAGGQAAGQYANGHIAAVERTSGNGKTLLIGTFPGGSYYLNHLSASREFFAGLPAWAGIQQQVQSSDPEVKARLHQGAGGTYIWVVNPTRTVRTAKITLPSAFQRATELWQQPSNPTVTGNTLAVTIDGRNAAVVRVE